ncbi:hypothetical protein GL50803_007851 [Giardia duodenalis]|uniref:Uncharacterized protein n=1 Tax=Giardia intestinalis (strain ATCC 50803 / WB clone C6) TaxID=184922 RepID=D3KG90_GIAIC|nr:hypothetical protein GL50803_007851 [Giardia intestinalis]KAE8303789.1 hypothetical protein GL50803_007851 [Giardia intestinalis]
MSAEVYELEVFKEQFKDRLDALTTLASGIQKAAAGRQWPSISSPNSIYNKAIPAIAAIQNEHSLLSESHQVYSKMITADVTCALKSLAQAYEEQGKEILSEYRRLCKEFMQYKCVKQPSLDPPKARQILLEFTKVLAPLLDKKRTLTELYDGEAKRALLRFVELTETLTRQEMSSVMAVRSALSVPGCPVDNNVTSEIYLLCKAITQESFQHI